MLLAAAAFAREGLYAPDAAPAPASVELSAAAAVLARRLPDYLDHGGPYVTAWPALIARLAPGDALRVDLVAAPADASLHADGATDARVYAQALLGVRYVVLDRPRLRLAPYVFASGYVGPDEYVDLPGCPELNLGVFGGLAAQGPLGARARWDVSANLTPMESWSRNPVQSEYHDVYCGQPRHQRDSWLAAAVSEAGVTFPLGADLSLRAGLTSVLPNVRLTWAPTRWSASAALFAWPDDTGVRPAAGLEVGWRTPRGGAP